MNPVDTRNLYEKVGYISATVKNVEEKVDKLVETVTETNETLSNYVTQEECEDRRPDIPDLIQELTDAIQTKGYKTPLVRLKENIVALVAIIGALGFIALGVVKFSHFIVRIDAALKHAKIESVAQATAIKKEIKAIRKIYAIPVPPTRTVKTPLLNRND